jgi:hypothetical protein
VLVATESVANVIDHAHTACRVRLGPDEYELQIEERDRYPCPQPRRWPGARGGNAAWWWGRCWRGGG